MCCGYLNVYEYVFMSQKSVYLEYIGKNTRNFFPLLGGVQSKNHNRGESDVTPEIRIHSGEDIED